MGKAFLLPSDSTALKRARTTRSARREPISRSPRFRSPQSTNIYYMSCMCTVVTPVAVRIQQIVRDACVPKSSASERRRSVAHYDANSLAVLVFLDSVLNLLAEVANETLHRPCCGITEGTN